MNSVMQSRKFRSIRFFAGLCGCFLFIGICHASPDAASAQQQNTVSDTSASDGMQVATLVPAPPVGVAPPTPEDLIPPKEDIPDPQKSAMTAAVADGVTTGLALSAGAVEANPLVFASPAGLIALTGAKIGLVKYGNKLPEQKRRVVMKTTSAVWGGAAANNMMVLMAVPTPASLVIGLVAGVVIWHNVNKQYKKQDEAMLAAHDVANDYQVAGK